MARPETPPASRYGVYPIGDHWRLCCGERVIGRFEYKSAALAAGAQAAREALSAGAQAELYVRDIDGPFRRADPASFAH